MAAMFYSYIMGAFKCQPCMSVFSPGKVAPAQSLLSRHTFPSRLAIDGAFGATYRYWPGAVVSLQGGGLRHCKSSCSTDLLPGFSQKIVIRHPVTIHTFVIHGSAPHIQPPSAATTATQITTYALIAVRRPLFLPVSLAVGLPSKLFARSSHQK